MDKTVLVADDDRIVSQILSERLKQLGLSVMRSPDATHALVGTQRLRPNLVILDVNLPGGNGLAVAEMLATDAEFCKIPVIIHTANSDKLVRSRCESHGHYYVQKGASSWDEIKAIVHKELDIPTDKRPAHDACGEKAQTLAETAAPAR